ncbi:hypothetical protein BDQ12DRAFT_667433 [Crucibulum laeve]|uniref:CN hydrolase domain-containing protein n=1 Tax=Crucibulum laeve TaxID=68775 RepID=A0A5C3LWY7_9AGAR|nr:hypothetical protein BDQ12DRAFT_667433 [Crucibulum laeve]
MNLRKLLFQDYATVVFPVLSLVLSSFAMQPTSALTPTILTLSGLLVYSRILFPSQRTKWHIALLWGALTVGTALPNITASLHALSSVTESLLALILLSVGILYIDTKASTRLESSWSQILLFPALWATLWVMVSYLSPLGRLSTWSPLVGNHAHNWMVPFLGVESVDWAAAAWAVVVAQAIGAWYIGNVDDEESLIPDNTTPRQQTIRITQARSALMLGILLTILAVPSFFLDSLPLPVTSAKTTPLGVACVLPTFQRYRHYIPTLKDYLDETKKVTNVAKVILWPEGAVTFNSEAERDEALTQVKESLQNHVYVGVSFEETFRDVNDPTGWTGSKRAGLALVSNSSDSPHLVYYKRHLVPITESFSLSQSTTPPAMHTIRLSKPIDVDAPDWAPGEPGNTRPLTLTAAICLDFAHPSTFSNLESRPSLILAPARTWDRSVGFTMWKQATRRAEELGSTLLWCDGGTGGVSGVAGKGYNDVTQVGAGSWTRTIVLPYPFNERRTAYLMFGDTILLLFWALVVGPSLIHWLSELQEYVRVAEATNSRRTQSDSQSFGSVNIRILMNATSCRAIKFHCPYRRTCFIPTSSPKQLLRSKFARSFLGTLRSSTKSSIDLARTLLRKRSSKGVQTYGWTDQFYLITREDFAGDSSHWVLTEEGLSSYESPSMPFAPISSFPDPPLPDLLLHSTPEATYISLSESSTSSLDYHPTELAELALSFPLPPTHVPTSVLTSSAVARALATKSIISETGSDFSSDLYSSRSLAPSFGLPVDIDLAKSKRRDLSSITRFFVDILKLIRTDVVDFGGEMDYSNYQWFQDPPPRQPAPQAPSAPQATAPAYVPLPGVIEQNEMFEFALAAAPNVLYARYKQYGQLGVLAWCSEFGELIDNLKDLGFQGNMFVTTRTQALKTCEELLKLKLDVKMQIIVMYLSSQVARLRRFLDGDRVWDDYPIPTFPLEPQSYRE